LASPGSLRTRATLSSGPPRLGPCGQPGAQRSSELTYNLVETEKGLLILAAELQEACLKRYELTGRTLASCKGRALEHIRFRHPFYDREAPIYLGEYVTLDSGTGSCIRLPLTALRTSSPAAATACAMRTSLPRSWAMAGFVLSLPLFGGMTIWEANPKIVQELMKRNVLFHHETYTHSYMHCWRHKTPVILRATTQWFAAMDKEVGGEPCARRRCAASSRPSSFRPGARRGCTA